MGQYIFSKILLDLPFWFRLRFAGGLSLLSLGFLPLWIFRFLFRLWRFLLWGGFCRFGPFGWLLLCGFCFFGFWFLFLLLVGIRKQSGEDHVTHLVWFSRCHQLPGIQDDCDSIR